MKAVLEDMRSHQEVTSFYAYRFQIPFFEFKLHYHPEFELTYILKGNGYRLVGNSHETFADGDLVLSGSNLPHTWVGKSSNEENFDAVVIQFSTSFITPFLGFEESAALKKMLEQSKKGLFFPAENIEVKRKLLKLVHSAGFDRILNLMVVLNQLTNCEQEVLCTNYFQSVYSTESENRINTVCVFLENNFSNKIGLKQVAALIHLTESNFCKFFKKATGKTFSDYLNEIRITRSCQLLLQSDKPINVIAFECGFETLSYFNRVFMNKKGLTPKEFRKLNLL
ncbi:AraC family transcriptional regulator [Flavobacterium sp. N3904]|uniref:AraC family transcriptional regulator n=1 Tax=Flavobacterium sp. N3904 TaxID=2986835 RepID=UPI002224B84D|nr:AraC family transcriptional regulator [Flavobacterium sp. N3904]